MQHLHVVPGKHASLMMQSRLQTCAEALFTMCDCLVAAKLFIAAAVLLQYADSQAHIDSAIGLVESASLAQDNRTRLTDMLFAECIWNVQLLTQVMHELEIAGADPGVIEELKSTMAAAQQRLQGCTADMSWLGSAAVPDDTGTATQHDDAQVVGPQESHLWRVECADLALDLLLGCCFETRP